MALMNLVLWVDYACFGVVYPFARAYFERFSLFSFFKACFVCVFKF